MKTERKHPARRHMEKLILVRRKAYHPLIHKIHKKHKISKRTLFYVKEYGPHSNVPKTIIRESIKILFFASVISSFGGLALENIKTFFISVTPMLILLPVLNGMIGNYGTIVSSKFSTLLHEGKVRGVWWRNRELRRLLMRIFIISLMVALSGSAIALLISGFSGYVIGTDVVLKVFYIVMIDVVTLVMILFFVAILAGLHFYRKGEDPNNFLIPITTSVADFGNMILLSVLVLLFF